MKYLILALFLLPVISSAQSKADYETMMDRFVRFYNERQTDSICTLFPKKDYEGEDCFWKWAIKGIAPYEAYGKVMAFKYLGIDETNLNKVAVFKVMYGLEGTRAMSFTLDADNKFRTFRFSTTSGEIEKMLNEN